MHIAVYLPLLLSVPLVLGIRALGRWAPPRAASWTVLAGCALVGLATVWSLGLLALAGLAGWDRFARVAAWSAASVRQAAPVPQVVGLAAGGLACVAVAASATCAARYLRRWRAVHRAALRVSSPLVVVDDPAPVAYAVPGARGGHVVVSRGMLNLLDANGRRAVLAHERAHLRCRHHLFVAGVRLLSTLNPALLLLRRTVVYTTERWADEVSAAVVGDRAVTADAIATAALATRRGPAPRALSATAGPVPARVAALLDAPEPGRGVARTRSLTLCTAAATAALLVTVGAAGLDATTDLHDNIETAQCAHDRHRCADATDVTDTTGSPILSELAAVTGLATDRR